MKHHERRIREKQELVQRILLAARKIALDEGWQSVTIRKIAEQIEYSPPVIYLYFESKEAILRALMEEGFNRMLAELERIGKGNTDAISHLVEIGKTYWRFAWQYPELYQVMHGLGGIPFGTSEAPVRAKELFEIVRSAIRAVREQRRLEGPVTDENVEILWAMLHGLVSLSMSERIPTKDWTEKYPLVERAVRYLIEGWQS